MHRLATVVVVASFAFGCGGDDGDDPSPSKQSYQVVFEDLGSALLSVWGTSKDDVWAVGGDPGDGKGPLVLHYDGAAWTRHATGTTGDLWWVHGFAGGPVFFGGDGGTILKYEAGSFESQTTPGASTVFGLWGSSPSDVWAVGGNGTDGGFAWRYDGSAWADAGLPADAPAKTSLFKIWGRNADDVWMVGSNGIALHWDGSAFSYGDTGTTRTLFTVHANAERFIAVGGFGDGVILENDGNGWQDVTPLDGTAKVRRVVGVCATAEATFAAGDYASILRREADGWAMVDTRLELGADFHAVWLDPSGGVWAVGGQTSALPLADGALVHSGEKIAAGSYLE
jgi:hypothetical protein